MLNSRAFDALGAVDDVLLLRLTITNVGTAVSMGPEPANSAGRMHEGLFIADCNFSRATGGFVFYLAAHELVMLGNRVDHRNGSAHLLRIPYIERGVISSNYFEGSGPTHHVIKIHALPESC